MKRYNLLYTFRREWNHSRFADIKIKAKFNQTFFGMFVTGKVEGALRADLARHTGEINIKKFHMNYEKPDERSKSDGCPKKAWYTSASNLFHMTYFLSTFFSECEDYLLNLSIYVPVKLENICPGIETYTLAKTASKAIPGYHDSILAVERNHNCFHFRFIMEMMKDSCEKSVIQAEWYVMLSDS